MGYVDPNSIHNPAAGTSPPAAWGDAIRDDLEWLARNHPHAHVYNSAAQSIPNNTLTAITFDSERVDVGGCHSTSSNTSRLVVPAGGDGRYRFSGCVSFAANVTGNRYLAVRKNGATNLRTFMNDASGGGVNGTDITISGATSLVAADYLELITYQTSGGALNVSVFADYSPDFEFEWTAL